MHRTNEFTEHFMRDGTVPTAGNSGSIFGKTITGDATAVYKGGVSGATGVLELALAATSEIENACVSMADKLHFDIANINSVEFRARLAVALGTTAATTQVAFGLTGNRNDTIDSIAQNILFRVLGNTSGAVIVESDDGTTDKDDIATGITLTDTWKNFLLDFRQGGVRDVRFFGQGSRGMVRIGGGTTFDMSAYTGGLQFFAQIQKAANTDLGTLQIDRFTVNFRE